jgi:hypothetical protein
MFGADADKARSLHVSLLASKDEHAYEAYHFQNVNAYISGLMRWMPRFNGVASACPLCWASCAGRHSRIAPSAASSGDPDGDRL